MNINSFSAGQVTSSVWANITRTLTDYGGWTTSEGGGRFAGTTGNGAKGAWTQIIASTAAIAKRLLVSIDASVAGVYNVDIGTGAGGSEVVLISNITMNLATAVGDASIIFSVPCNIPAGTRFAVRAQSTAANTYGASITFLE